MQTTSIGPGILPAPTPPLPAVVKDGFDAALAAPNPMVINVPAQWSPPSAALTKLSGETQKLIDLGNAMGRIGPQFSAASLSLDPSAGMSGVPGGPVIDLTALNRAYDFAMRSYLLSKVASEVSGGLRSLWQAQ
jgi:hypothetical protein